MWVSDSPANLDIVAVRIFRHYGPARAKDLVHVLPELNLAVCVLIELGD